MHVNTIKLRLDDWSQSGAFEREACKGSLDKLNRAFLEPAGLIAPPTMDGRRATNATSTRGELNRDTAYEGVAEKEVRDQWAKRRRKFKSTVGKIESRGSQAIGGFDLQFHPLNHLLASHFDHNVTSKRRALPGRRKCRNGIAGATNPAQTLLDSHRRKRAIQRTCPQKATGKDFISLPGGYNLSYRCKRDSAQTKIAATTSWKRIELTLHRPARPGGNARATTKATPGSVKYSERGSTYLPVSRGGKKNTVAMQ